MGSMRACSEPKAVSSKNAKLTDRALRAIHAAVYFLCGMLLSQGLYAALFLALCSMLLAPCFARSRPSSRERKFRSAAGCSIRAGVALQNIDAFLKGLRELGWVEGQNIAD